MTGSRLSQIALIIVAPILVLLVVGIGWQLIAYNLKTILPPLEQVAQDFLSRPDFYASNLWVTLYAALMGFVIGGGIAIFLAVLIVHFAFLNAAIVPVALMLNVTPVVAISPALIVAFGFNATPHIIVAAVAAFFPMLINAITGLRAVDKQALEVFNAMSATGPDIFWRLRLPSALPFLFSGAKLSVTAAMVGSIVSEFMGTSKGIGATIVMATSFLNLTQMWAAIFISIVTSLVLIGILSISERLIIRW